jgi:glycosyltransferase involved in cell wall biosynthesis
MAQPHASSSANLGTPELSVIMPVYNEEGAIETVLAQWIGPLRSLGVRFEIRAYDDGSRDRTGAILARLSATVPELAVISHANRGHGPTILRGYHEARGTWVFQIDSDGEMGPEHFAKLWDRRDDYDLLFGARHDRSSPLARRIVTRVSRATVGLLFGHGVSDVNVPYRLMRASCLRRLLAHVPDQTFAPNVAIAGLARRSRLRLFETPVPSRARTTGAVSIVRWGLVRAAVLSFAQTVSIGLRARARAPLG